MGTAPPCDPVDERSCALSITPLTTLNWSATWLSLNARAPDGNALYQLGAAKKVVVGPSSVTAAGMLKFAAEAAKAFISEAADEEEDS